MVKAAASPILHLIRRAVEDGRVRELPDHELLHQFHAQQDQAAFHALLRRHGTMVLDVCRSVLRNEADAEDAFQATFLVLARKAGAIRKTGSVGSWLHGVAYRTALKARAQSALRQKCEARAPVRPAPDPDDLSWREVRQALHDELSGLPERYRGPLVLCYLEGAMQEAAAVHLGLPRSTLRERLERGRALLRTRLVRRGLGPTALLAAAAGPAMNATAGVPVSLMLATARAASLYAAGRATAAGVLSSNVAALTEGVLKTMLLTKLKIATAVLVVTTAALLLVAGLGAPALPAPAQEPAQQKEDKELDKGPAGKQVAAEPVKAGAKSIRSLAYCNDGNPVALVLSKNEDLRIPGSVVLDVQKGTVQHTLEGFETGRPSPSRPLFFNVTASKDGATIAVASAQFRNQRWEGSIKVWDARTGTLVKGFELDGQATAVALSADGAKVIGGARTFPVANGKMFVWDVKRGELLQTLEAKGLEYYAAAISDDGKWIGGAGDAGDPTYEGKVVVWEVETGKVKHEWAGLPTMYAVALSPDGKQVAAAGWLCNAFAISPDGKPVATAGPGPGAAAGPDDKVIRVWDMQTGKLKHKLKPEGGVRIAGLVFSSDGETLATADFDGSVSLWDVAKETRVTTKGHGGSAWCVAFSPDGRTLASGGDDGTLRFWPVAQAKQPKK